VALQAIGEFAAGEVRPGLVLGFGGIPLDHIDEGLRRLRVVIGA
jgi:DNA-binding transcriptional MocR family regulator